MTKSTPINDFLGAIAVQDMSFLGVPSDMNTSNPKGLAELWTKLKSTKGFLDEYVLNSAQDLLPKTVISATPRYAKLISRFEKINWATQKNTVGLGNFFGFMANYRYIIDDIEKTTKTLWQMERLRLLLLNANWRRDSLKV